MIEESREHLVEVANSITSETERVKYVLNYFLKNVEYNYAYLFCAFMQGDIVASMLKIVNNESEWFFDMKMRGHSDLLDEIVNEYHKNQDINDIRKIVVRELEKHIDNHDIVEKEADIFINSLLDNIDKKKTVTTDILESVPVSDLEGLFEYMTRRNSLELDKSITTVLFDYLGDENLHITMPPVIEDGILKRGVCRDYADYLAELLNEVGIEAYRIDGISELNHAWVAAKIDGSWKSIDLVRAVFIRDHYEGIPSNQAAEDWLLNDFDVCFEMQPSRKIISVWQDGNNIKLPESLFKDNFDQNFFAEFLDSLKSVNRTLGIK